MERLIRIKAHSGSGKLYVDLFPHDTVLKVAAEGDDAWFVDPQANELQFDHFILIPKKFAEPAKAA